MSPRKLKVMTIAGTRPELIKLSRVLALLDQHTEHVFVHTGQNFDFSLNEVFFHDLEIRKPDHFLACARDTAIETIAASLVESDRVLAKENPDALLLYGDTNSCLSVIAAKKRKIPIFHMEAGNRCFDQRVPEEINRKIVDHLSDINMPLTEHARRYLIAEGLPAENVIKTGSCMFEVLKHYQPQIQASQVMQKLNLKPGQFFLVSSHREENVDVPANLRELLLALNSLAENYGHRVIVSTHPRTRKRLDALTDVKMNAKVEFLDAMGFHDYVHLQKNAFCVLSDSGTIMEESALLDIPAVMLRAAHERPEGFDGGILVQSELKAERILNAVQVVTALANPRARENFFGSGKVPDYQIDNVSSAVLKIILSYTDYVNRTVWYKA
jgi:UDP-N-acetylglucosamine 2-epimerase